MCVAAFHWQPGSAIPLILVHNRDEYHARPAAPAALHRVGAATLLHGTDLAAGGTWLAADGSGRIALVVNFRQGPGRRAAKSRGSLPIGFVASDDEPAAYLETIRAGIDAFAPFILVCGTARDGLASLSSPAPHVQMHGAGLHTISNGGVDTGWPKERRVADRIRAALAARPAAMGDLALEEELLLSLADRTPAPADQLPSTGVDKAVEQMLSAVFIQSPTYGTRASTLVLIDANSRIVYRERSFAANGECTGDVRLPA
jgi:uncharacterized protein with NRDE domain